MANIKRGRLSRARIRFNKRNDYEEREPEGGLQPVSSFSNSKFIAASIEVNERELSTYCDEKKLQGRVRNRRNNCVVKPAKRYKNIISSSLNSNTKKVVTVVKRNNNIHRIDKVIKINRNYEEREPESGLQPVLSFKFSEESIDWNKTALSTDGYGKKSQGRVRNRRNNCVVKPAKRYKNIISPSLNSNTKKVVTVVKRNNNIPKVDKAIKINRNKEFSNKNKYNEE